MSSNIGTSTFTIDWLLSTLKKVDTRFESAREVENVKEISGGKGFASKVYLCHLNTKDDVVLKVPEAGKLEEVCGKSEASRKLPSICIMHDVEVQFYNDYGRMGIIQLPKIYKTQSFGPDAKEHGYLLMECLAQNVGMGQLADGFSRHQLHSMAKDFAKFQAYFLKLEDKSWIQRYHKEMDKTTLPIIENLLIKLKELEPQMFGEGVDKFIPYVRNQKFANWTYYKGHNSLGLPPVLAHGNLWTNNIFMKKNDDGSLSNEVAAYIDWQLTHAGNLTADLSSVLILCTDPDIRRQYTQEILQQYYDTLCEELGNIPFLFNKVLELYNINFHAQCWNLAIAVVFHPQMISDFSEEIQETMTSKMHLRCQYAIEDAVALLSTLPAEFNIENRLDV